MCKEDTHRMLEPCCRSELQTKPWDTSLHRILADEQACSSYVDLNRSIFRYYMETSSTIIMCVFVAVCHAWARVGGRGPPNFPPFSFSSKQKATAGLHAIKMKGRTWINQHHSGGSTLSFCLNNVNTKEHLLIWRRWKGACL